MQPIWQWIEEHQQWLWTAGAISIAVVLASVFIIPAVIVRIRPDYFAHDERPPAIWADQYPFVRILIVLGKNILGVVLVLAGLAMFVLPGQGMLTLLVGFFLIDFPRKYRFEKWLVHKRPILRPINWLRRRAGREELQTSERPESQRSK